MTRSRGIIFGLPAEDGGSGRPRRSRPSAAGDPGPGCRPAVVRAAADRLAGLGFTRLDIAVLSTNGPARGFYEAMGGTDVGERIFDEEVQGWWSGYSWPDLRELTG